MQNLIGQKVRRCTFSLYLDGSYYVIFSVIEKLESDMDDDYGDNGFYIKRAKHNKYKSKDKIYFTIDYFTITEEFLNNPVDNYIVNGTQFLFFSSSEDYLISPDSFDLYLLASNTKLEKSSLGLCLPFTTSTRMLNIVEDKSRKAEKVILNDKDFCRQMEQLSIDEWGVNLLHHKNVFGNIYFVRYNPYFRKVDFSINTQPPGLYVSIFPREDFVEQLFLEISNKTRDGLYLWTCRFEIAPSRINHFFELPSAIDTLDIKISDNAGNLIYAEDNMHFIKAISISAGIQSSTLKSKDSKGNSRITSKFTHESFTIGNNDSHDIVLSSPEQAYKILEDSLDFVFFDGNKQEATQNKDKAFKILTKILSTARRECFICDPYFNNDNLLDFVFPLESLNVMVKILAGEEFMGKNVTEKVMNENVIAKNVLAYNETYGEKIQFKVLTGKCPLHDRFIIADDNVWLIGCSFNEFGNRATTIKKITDVSKKLFSRTVNNWWYSDKDSRFVKS